MPALSKAWKEWAQEQRAEERTLEEAGCVDFGYRSCVLLFYVPAWAAQHHQEDLSDEQKRRFQLRAAAHGDVVAATSFGAIGDGAKFDICLCAAAALGGQLEALQWLHANSCEWDASTCSCAALGGHLAVLQWARANGCDWDADMCQMAAANGHLDVLQWARANGCEWNAETFVAAAEAGHLAVLQWARANGCPCDAETCAIMEHCGHQAVLDWMRANGYPGYTTEEDESE